MGDGDRPMPASARRGETALELTPREAAEWAQAAIVWLGGGIGIGVLGNAAYDALKAAIGRLRRDTRTLPLDADMVLIARSALDIRCREMAYEQPDDSMFADVQVIWEPDGFCDVVFKGEGVAAKVTIGTAIWDDNEVKTVVRIRRWPGVYPSRTKVTVHLAARSLEALDEACTLTGDNKTDTINKALRLYALIQKRLSLGDSLLLEDSDGQKRQIHFA